MVSYQEALTSVLHCNIQPLIQLKRNLSKLDQELEILNSKKEDTELELRRLERPGRRRKGQVDKWLKDVEQIKEKREDIMNQINEILSNESIDEVIEEVIKDVENHRSAGPSQQDTGNSKAIVGVKKTILGMGGIGDTNIILTNSPPTFNFDSIQIHNYDSRQGNGANAEREA